MFRAILILAVMVAWLGLVVGSVVLAGNLLWLAASPTRRQADDIVNTRQGRVADGLLLAGALVGAILGVGLCIVFRKDGDNPLIVAGPLLAFAVLAGTTVAIHQGMRRRSALVA